MPKTTQRIRVILQSPPRVDPITWHAYQRYYAMGFRKLDDVQFEHATLTDRVLAAARDLGLRGAQQGWRLAARDAALRSEVSTHVGRYMLQFPNLESPLRVAIDAHDSRHIRDLDAYDWAQVYFKVSYWPTLNYGPKVRPLVCGNGALTEKRIARLIAMRDQPRDLDLVFIAKLWPSNPAAPTYWNPVEHVVRTFETLARLKIRSHLRAILVPLATKEPMPQGFIDRLHKAGVPVTAHDATAEELWQSSRSSEIAFLRPGMHLCVSWRMIDHLAMGACTMADHAPYPEWPVPLQAGREYIDADCGINPDISLPPVADYERIADSVMSLLSDAERRESTRRAAAAYFDAHVAPPRIARYIVDTCSSVAAELPGKIDPYALEAPALTGEPHTPLATSVGVDDTGVHPLQTSLLEFTHDAVIIWEMNGRGIIYWNSAAEQLYGFSRKEARGSVTHTLLQTELVGGVNAIEAQLARFGVWVGELRHTTKAGQQIFVDARLAVLSQADGGWLVLEVNRDVSDKKRAAGLREALQVQMEELRDMRSSAYRSDA